MTTTIGSGQSTSRFQVNRVSIDDDLRPKLTIQKSAPRRHRKSTTVTNRHSDGPGLYI
jgi:hypothetical protein